MYMHHVSYCSHYISRPGVLASLSMTVHMSGIHAANVALP